MKKYRIKSQLGDLILELKDDKVESIYIFDKTYKIRLTKENPPVIFYCLQEYFISGQLNFDQSILHDYLMSISEFQRLVYEETLKIPKGETRSYQDIASSIGRPSSSRAVGNALAKNKLPIIIPCHRVIKSNGSIGNYIFGPKYKKDLIELENKKDG